MVRLSLSIFTNINTAMFQILQAHGVLAINSTVCIFGIHDICKISFCDGIHNTPYILFMSCIHMTHNTVFMIDISRIYNIYVRFQKYFTNILVSYISMHDTQYFNLVINICHTQYFSLVYVFDTGYIYDAQY